MVNKPSRKGYLSHLGLALTAFLCLGALVLAPDTSSGESPEPQARDVVKKRTIETGLFVGHWQATTLINGSFVGDPESVNRSAVYVFGDIGIVLNDGFEAGYFSGNVTLLFEPFGAHYYQPFSASAFGGTFNLRYNFLSFGRWLPFAEVGTGPIWMDLAPRIPEQDSKLALATQLGAGVRYFLTERAALALAVRWHHISNASTGDRNDGMNAILPYLGVSYYFPK